MNNDTGKIKLYFVAFKDQLEFGWTTNPTTFSTNPESLLPYFDSNVQVILQIEAKIVDIAKSAE